MRRCRLRWEPSSPMWLQPSSMGRQAMSRDGYPTQGEACTPTSSRQSPEMLLSTPQCHGHPPSPQRTSEGQGLAPTKTHSGVGFRGSSWKIRTCRKTPLGEDGLAVTL